MKGRDKGGKENWLLIKAEDEYARESGEDGLLEGKPRSVKTGRTVEDVAGSEVKIRREGRGRREAGVRPLAARWGRPCQPARDKSRAPARGLTPFHAPSRARCRPSSSRSWLRSPAIRRRAMPGCTRSSSTATACSPASIAAG